jgi:uncharacterized protein
VRAETAQRLEIPAREGRAFTVSEAERIRISSPRGHQAADFFAFDAADLSEFLSAPATWTAARSLRPRPGQSFLSTRRRPLLDFVEDGAGAVHDMLLAACDLERYRQLGVEGWHPSCAENLVTAMRGLGHELTVVPQPINFFTYSNVLPDQSFETPPNPVPAGAYVVLEARRELLCVVSACPFDLPLWQINGPEPSELVVEVLGAT